MSQKLLDELTYDICELQTEKTRYYYEMLDAIASNVSHSAAYKAASALSLELLELADTIDLYQPKEE